MIKRYQAWAATHRKAWRTIRLAVLALVVLGWFHARAAHWPLWHGEFCSLANGVTDGCDVAPANHATYVVEALEYCTVVPLLAATISLFTTSATAEHVRRHVATAASEIKRHTEARLRHHLGTPAEPGAAAEEEDPKCQP